MSKLRLDHGDALVECPACEAEQWARCDYCERERYVSKEKAEIIRLQVDANSTDKIKP